MDIIHVSSPGRTPIDMHPAPCTSVHVCRCESTPEAQKPAPAVSHGYIHGDNCKWAAIIRVDDGKRVKVLCIHDSPVMWVGIAQCNACRERGN